MRFLAELSRPCSAVRQTRNFAAINPVLSAPVVHCLIANVEIVRDADNTAPPASRSRTLRRKSPG